MSKSTKSVAQKGAMFNAQYDMCDIVYRKLFELMISVGSNSVIIGFDNISFRLDSDGDCIRFYLVTQRGNTSGIGFVPLKKISTTDIEDPVMCHILSEKEFEKNKPETYTKWLESVKKFMQQLLEEQKKYENIIENIKSIPLFSPTREVLIEKEIK
jgi:hypothetical protein